MTHRQRLLETAPADVPPAVRDAARQFCEANPEVEAGWLCRVERRRQDGDPIERLAFAVELRGHIEQPSDHLAAGSECSGGFPSSTGS